MRGCTVHYGGDKIPTEEITGGKIIHKDSDNYIIHFNSKNPQALNFNSENMKGNLMKSSNTFENIDIIGFREWIPKYEVNMIVNRDRNPGINSNPTYYIEFRGSTSFGITSKRNEFDITINDENFKVIFDDNNVNIENINSSSNKLYYNIKKNFYEIDLNIDVDVCVLNFGLFNQINKLEIGKSNYSNNINKSLFE